VIKGGLSPLPQGGKAPPSWEKKKNSRMKIFKFSNEMRSYNLKKRKSIGYSQFVEYVYPFM